VLLEDIPDRSAGPAGRYEARESIELSFIVALQHVPPRHRAALMLGDLLGFRIAEVAEMLDAGEPSVKGALQRARASLRARLPAADRERAPRPNSASERQLVGCFADAVPSGDVTRSSRCSPTTPCSRCRPRRSSTSGTTQSLLSCGTGPSCAARRCVSCRPGPTLNRPLGCYLPDAHAPIARPYGLIVLTLEGDAIAAITWFADTGVFRHFGLRRTLPSL
jgi:hypothetical protein